MAQFQQDETPKATPDRTNFKEYYDFRTETVSHP